MNPEIVAVARRVVEIEEERDRLGDVIGRTFGDVQDLRQEFHGMTAAMWKERLKLPEELRGMKEIRHIAKENS